MIADGARVRRPGQAHYQAAFQGRRVWSSLKRLQVGRERSQLWAFELVVGRHGIARLEVLGTGDPAGDVTDAARQGAGREGAARTDLGEIRPKPGLGHA